MSSIVCVRGSDGIMLVSDGITYNDEGVILGTRVSKVTPLVEWNAVIGNVGAGMVTQAFRNRLEAWPQNFDDIKGCAVNYLDDIYNQYRMQNYGYSPDFTFILAGWSEEHSEYQSFVVSSHDRFGDVLGASGELETLPAWELRTPQWFWASTCPPPEYCKQFGIDWQSDVGICGAANSTDLAMRVLCANRAMSGPKDQLLTDDEGHYAVGGFIQMTILRKDSIEQRIIHRWPDEWGTRVDPTAGDPRPFLSWDPVTLLPLQSGSPEPVNDNMEKTDA